MSKPLGQQRQPVDGGPQRGRAPRGRRIDRTYSPTESNRWSSQPALAAVATTSADPTTSPLQPLQPLRAVRASEADELPLGAFSAPARAAGATFHSAPLSLSTPAAAEVTVLMDGSVHYFAAAPGQTILEAAHATGLDLPGSCATPCHGACRCTLAGDTVDLPDDTCLTADERDARQVLACVGRPTSAWVILDFD